MARAIKVIVRLLTAASARPVVLRRLQAFSIWASARRVALAAHLRADLSFPVLLPSHSELLQLLQQVLALLNLTITCTAQERRRVWRLRLQSSDKALCRWFAAPRPSPL